MGRSSHSRQFEVCTVPQPFASMQFPGREAGVRSYNPSLAWHRGSLVMGFRVSTMNRCGGQPVDFERHYSGELAPMLNAVGVGSLDPATMTVRDARVLDLDMPDACPWNRGYEDPRVFSFAGSLFILASRRNERCYFALSIIELDDHMAVRRVVDVVPDFDALLHQKNWNPFVWNDRLFFVTSIAPHRIAEIDLTCGKAARIHESPSTLFSGIEAGREIRGGAGYVRAGDRYIGICRTALNEETNRNDYLCVAYAFAAAPPFRVTGRSAPFLFGAADSPNAPLQMATGLAEVDGDYLIAFGEEDCDMKLARVARDRLLASIEPG